MLTTGVVRKDLERHLRTLRRHVGTHRASERPSRGGASCWNVVPWLPHYAISLRTQRVRPWAPSTSGRLHRLLRVGDAKSSSLQALTCALSRCVEFCLWQVLTGAHVRHGYVLDYFFGGASWRIKRLRRELTKHGRSLCFFFCGLSIAVLTRSCCSLVVSSQFWTSRSSHHL